jgi:hypothetical protein
MAITIFPNIKLLHDISLPDAFWGNRTGCATTDAEYYFYWYCSLLQEDNEQGMMACDNDEFLSGAYNILELSHNRLAHA